MSLSLDVWHLKGKDKDRKRGTLFPAFCKCMSWSPKHLPFCAVKQPSMLRAQGLEGGFFITYHCFSTLHASCARSMWPVALEGVEWVTMADSRAEMDGDWLQFAVCAFVWKMRSLDRLQFAVVTADRLCQWACSQGGKADSWLFLPTVFPESRRCILMHLAVTLGSHVKGNGWRGR